MGRTSMTVRLCLINWLCVLLVTASPVVNLENGMLEGSVKTSSNGKEILSFQGIPYARPPVGELRFKPPEPAEYWTGIRSAKEDASKCIQRDFFLEVGKIDGTEDCLYLNVYTPKLPIEDNEVIKTSFPVMVWIHGGAFFMGSSDSMFFGPEYLLNHEVVLVTMNYRLGPLGFMSTGDMVLPGNLGMKDQVQALRWVKKNIDKFGGDPNSVTIFGESAGGVCVHSHMFSPLSKGLFHRAISQSGTIFSPWAYYTSEVARKDTERVGELLNCPTKNSTDLVDCLRNKDMVDIVTTLEKFMVIGIDPLVVFRPVIEVDHPDAFLKEEPSESLRSGNINDVPWLTGINSHEGALRVMFLFGSTEKDSPRIMDEKWSELAPISLFYDNTRPKSDQAEVSRKIREFYLGDKKIEHSSKFELIDMYSDAWFNFGTHESVRSHIQSFSSPVYYYHFSYKGRYSYSNVFSFWEDYGTSHGDEIQFLFPLGIKFFFGMIGLPVSARDAVMVDTMTSMWYNFAKTGNPTPEVSKKIPPNWTPVRTRDLEYLEIADPSNLKMSKNLNRERMDFWESLVHRGPIVPSTKQLKDEL